MGAKRLDSRSDAVLELKMLSEQILENQTKMQEDIREIKKSIFDPDEGLYARVRGNTQFRTSAGKWLWILTTGLLLSLLKVVFNFFMR